MAEGEDGCYARLVREESAWRFLDSGALPGAHQMALDDALLEACAQGKGGFPVLRVFAFQPVCLSLGRFQPGRTAGFEATRIDTVRRPTGGRAVLHAGDLCYSMVARADDPNVGGGIRESYMRIGAPLARAQGMLGVAVRLRRTPAAGARPMATGGAACFAAVAPFEAALPGGGAKGKLIGSAQVRRGPAFLQQGSVRLTVDRTLEALLLPEAHAVPTLSELLARDVTYTEMAFTLREAFQQALDIKIVEGRLSDRERALAERLEHERYGNLDWMWRSS